VKLGGHNVTLNETADILTFSYMQPSDFRLEISAALYLSGRVDEALAIFKTILPPDNPKAFQICGRLIGEPGRVGCTAYEPGPPRWRLLELALEKPQEDPYELVESQYGRVRGADALGTGLWIQVSLRRLVEYRSSVAGVASRWSGDRASTLDGKPLSDLLAATFDPALVARADQIARSIALVQTHFPPAAKRSDVRHGKTSPRDPKGLSRFRRIQLPKDCPAPMSATNWKEPAVQATVNRFSEIEQFWRVETAGQLVVVVAQMSSSGIWEEEGLGGVWLHVSQDGGKTWKPPLYTGLESTWNFTMSPFPCVSGLDGDHLILELLSVPIIQVDGDGQPLTKTPAPAASRVAIDIPLSTLRRDSDRDGLTDIVEEALLLDPRNRDSDGDGVADGEDSFPNVSNKPTSDLAGPMAAVLSSVVNDPRRRHLPADITAKAGTEPLSPRFKERPLILFAEPRVLAGISADRMVLVFAAKDLPRLAERRSQISGTRFDEPVLNRARDRGHIKFDNGLTGGTFAWRREGNGWKGEQISSFIR
jgi:hypothetical protein